MRKIRLFCAARRRSLLLLIVCARLIFPTVDPSVFAQSASEEEIVITGEEVPSAYGAPPGISRIRFSNTTQAYVLPPWSFFFGEIYECDGCLRRAHVHLFTPQNALLWS